MKKRFDLLSFCAACIVTGLFVAVCTGVLPSKTKAREAKPEQADTGTMVLESKVSALEDRLSKLEALEAHVAHLSAREKNSDYVSSKIGPLMVSLADASPYLDGYRLKLWLGNPHMVTINGCQVTLSWGTNARNQKVSGELKRGAWTSADIVLTPATADDLSDIQVFLTPASMSLDAPHE